MNILGNISTISVCLFMILGLQGSVKINPDLINLLTLADAAIFQLVQESSQISDENLLLYANVLSTNLDELKKLRRKRMIRRVIK